MSPRKALPDPMDDAAMVGEISASDAEKLAAGDIALYNDPIFDGYHWTIRRKRTREEIAADPEAGVWEIVTKKVGQLDPVVIMPELGGGVFEFRGYFDHGDGDGRRLTRRDILALVGPRKDFARREVPQAAIPTAVVATTPPIGSDPLMIRMSLLLEAMDRRLNSLESREPAGKREGIGELIGALKGLDELRGRGNSGGEIDMAAGLDLFRQGLAIGQERDPLPADAEPKGTDWTKVVENIVAVLERMSRRGPPRRVVSAGPGAAPAPPPSSAEVIDPPVMDPGAARWITALDRLETMVRSSVDADEAAEEIGVILTESDLGGILPYPNEAVIEQIVARVRSDSVLATPDGRAYLALVLDELRKPDSGD